MSKDYCSPPALRVLGPFPATTGADDSLQAQNTFEVPDGAIAYVVSSGAVFQFQRASTATAVTNAILVPAAGPGRWVLLSSTFSSANPAWSAAIQLTPPGVADLAVTTNTWSAITGGTFAAGSVIANMFTLTAAAGILTYNGPGLRTFEIAVDASIGNGQSGTASQIAVAPAVNGDLIGATTNAPYQQECMTNATQDAPCMIRSVRHAVLANGVTIQPAVKNITAGDLDLNVLRMVMTIRPSP